MEGGIINGIIERSREIINNNVKNLPCKVDKCSERTARCEDTEFTKYEITETLDSLGTLLVILLTSMSDMITVLEHGLKMQDKTREQP